jgi:formate dehydrogenase
MSEITSPAAPSAATDTGLAQRPAVVASPASSEPAESGAGTSTVKTFCRICLAFCGIEVTVSADGKTVEEVHPDKGNPYSWKSFCIKGRNSGKHREDPRRLTSPMRRTTDGSYVEATWDEAIQDIGTRLRRIRDRHGPHAIATYLGNPGAHNQPGTLAQGGFMKAVGSDNAFYVGSVDTNNLNVVCREMYGSEMAVLVPDVDHAKCFLFIGMNPAVSQMVWLDTVPNGWKRVTDAQKRGADMIVVDPRQTPTTKKADTHVRVRPGEDWALLLAIIKVVFANGWIHEQDCSEANGVPRLRAIAEGADLDELSARCGVSVEQIEDVARRFATAETAVCVARTGVSQNRNGTLGEWLSYALNLITGRIDRKGGRVFNRGMFKKPLKVLHAFAPPVKRRSRIGNHVAVSGAYPMAIMADEILTPGQDQVRAMIINSGNPVISGPDGVRLDEAFQQLDLLVALDFNQRESHRHAHWLIPGTHFLERDEFYALFSGWFDVPYMQLGQKVVDPLPGTRTEWDFFVDVTLAMRRPFLGIPGMNTIIKLSRRVAERTGNPHHAFNVRWIWAAIITLLTPLKWKDLVANPQGIVYGEKTYGQFRDHLMTPDKRIHAAPEMFVQALHQRLDEPVPTVDDDYPFRLVNQRRANMMNSWLVEVVHRPRAYGEHVDMHPADVERLGLQAEQQVRVASPTGAVRVKVRPTEEVPPGIVSIDHGWGSRMFDPTGKRPTEVQGAPRNHLVSSDGIDELSGMPNLNGTAVSVRAI